MKRVLLFVVVFFIFVGIWLHFQKISCKMVGLSTSLGPIQSEVEAPFFTNSYGKSSTSLSCQYVPKNNQGVKDAYLLRYLQQGFYDLAAITFRQMEGSDIAMVGMDMPGLPLDFSSSKTLSRDFLPFLDNVFEKKFQSKIITTFAFGPLELFCKKPIYNLADLQGLKIRITTDQDGSIFKLFTALGAKPLKIDYGETFKALQNDFIDCGASSYISAENAGWFKYLPYRIDLPIGNAVSAYVINLKTWNTLNSQQKSAFTNSIMNLSNSMWDFSEKMHEQSLLPCARDDLSCLQRPKLITFNQSEMERLNQISIDVVLKPWLSRCNEIYLGCESEWLSAAKKSKALQNLELNNL